jgi:hypothetical protein
MLAIVCLLVYGIRIDQSQSLYWHDVEHFLLTPTPPQREGHKTPSPQGRDLEMGHPGSNTILHVD